MSAQILESIKTKVYTMAELEKIASEFKCGFCGGKVLTVQMYPHDGGALVENREGRQWVNIHCHKCGYDWALWKVLRRLE